MSLASGPYEKIEENNVYMSDGCTETCKIDHRVLLKVGWIFKYRLFFPFHCWSKYWFVLNQMTCNLSYYKNPYIPRNIRDFPMFQLLDVKSGEEIQKKRLRLPDWLSKESLIKLEIPKRSMLLCCEDELQAREWKIAFQFLMVERPVPCLDENTEDVKFIQFPKLYCSPYVDYEAMLELEKIDRRPSERILSPTCFACFKNSQERPPKKYSVRVVGGVKEPAEFTSLRKTGKASTSS